MKSHQRNECSRDRSPHLTRLGINSDRFEFTVALTGNPNTGKSTVFNRLTGLRQHTGNWPGKTVTRAEGGFIYHEKRYKLIDLPGTYSLLSNTTDEEIARNFILFGQPDVTVIVVDAMRLERNLNLVLQILEITEKCVLCLNLVDEASRHRITVNETKLAADLGVPVVPATARKGLGMAELLKAIHAVVHGLYPCRPHRIRIESETVRSAVELLVEKLRAAYPGLPNIRWIALRLLEGDVSVIEAVRNNELASLAQDPMMEKGIDAARAVAR